MTCTGVVTVAAEDLALAETLRKIPDVRGHLERVVEPPAKTRYLWLSGRSEQAVHAALEADRSVHQVEQLADGDGEWLYGVEFDGAMATFCQLVRSHQGAMLSASVGGTTWTVRLRFPTRETFTATVEALDDVGYAVTVERLHSLDHATVSRATDGLTDRQYEILALALEQGYFEVPREVTLEEIAAEIGVSEQAASERIRRAHETVTAMFVGETDTPAFQST